MWSSTGIWDHFEDLYRQGELRLPGMWESGYALCQEKTDKGTASGWTLYKRNVALMDVCRKPELSVFHLWHTVRPMVQIMLASKQKTGGSGAVQRLHRGFYELLVQSDCVDESSPEAFRIKRV